MLLRWNQILFALLLLVFATTANAMQWDLECADLLAVSSQQTAAVEVIRNLLAVEDLPLRHIPVSYDEEVPELLSFAPISPHEVAAHELRTARDYAIFLKQIRNHRFILLSHWGGRSVPVFDGLAFDSQSNQVVANISLKYASVRMGKVQLEALKHSLVGRLDAESELHHLRSPAFWFLATNHRPNFSRLNRSPDYLAMLARTRQLTELFGLFNRGQSGWGDREFRTVWDVRNHGYPFAFFKEPHVQEAIFEIVRNAPGQALTLLWNSQEVVEIDRSGVRLYSP